MRHSLPSCLFQFQIWSIKTLLSMWKTWKTKSRRPLRISSNSKDSMNFCLLSQDLSCLFLPICSFFDELAWTKCIEMLFSKPTWPVENYFFPTASNKEHLLLHPLLYPKGTKQEGAQMCHASEGDISLMQRMIISKLETPQYIPLSASQVMITSVLEGAHKDHHWLHLRPFNPYAWKHHPNSS